MAAPIFSSVTLLEKELAASEMMRLRFTRPSDFIFSPGQFTQFQIPAGEDDTVLRSYSIASSAVDGYLEFYVKMIPGGKAPAYFNGLSAGAAVALSQAQGRFVCEPDHQSHKIFIATSSGLAPFLSMISDCLPRQDAIHLLFGVRNEENLFVVDKINRWQSQYQNFFPQITLSQPGALWTGLRGRVTDHLDKLIKLNAEYYLCGGIEMVREVRALILARGVPPKLIHLEIF